MNLFAILSGACPLLLCSIGALYSEYAGILALYLDGLISLTAFLTFFYTTLTGSVAAGVILCSVSSVVLMLIFSLVIERFKVNQFIAAIAINLLFSCLPSFISSVVFGTRGVLTDSRFSFNLFDVRLYAIIVTVILVTAGILFVAFTRPGLYLRITGSDANVLVAKGVNPGLYRILSWGVAGFYASIAGGILALRINAFVPNIASGRGWMALAAIFLGKKKNLRIIIGVLIFCMADIFSANIQNFLPAIPGSVVLSIPYLVILLCCIVQ